MTEPAAPPGADLALFGRGLEGALALNENPDSADTHLDKWSSDPQPDHEQHQEPALAMNARATTARKAPARPKALRPTSIAEAVRAHRPSEGHGRRLTAPLQALQQFPVPADARNPL